MGGSRGSIGMGVVGTQGCVGIGNGMGDPGSGYRVMGVRGW